MKEKIKELSDMQQQLNAMIKACKEYEKGLNDKRDEFILSLGFLKGSEISLYDIMSKLHEKSLND